MPITITKKSQLTPAGQQEIKKQEYRESLVNKGYTVEQQDGRTIYKAPVEKIEYKRKGVVEDSKTYSPHVYVYDDKGNLVEEQTYSGYVYKRDAHVALTYSKQLEGDRYTIRNYDIEGYSTKLRSQKYESLAGDYLGGESYGAKHYGNKYWEAEQKLKKGEPLTKEEIETRGMEKVIERNTGLTEQQYKKATALTPEAQQREYGGMIVKTRPVLTQSQYKQAASFTEQEQMRRYGRVVYVQQYKHAKPQEYLTIGDKTVKVGYALAEKIRKDMSTPKQVQSTESNTTTEKQKNIFNKIKDFVQLPSEERRSKTINFLDTKLTGATQVLFKQIKIKPYSIYGNSPEINIGDMILKDTQEVYTMEGEPSIKSVSGIRKIGSAALYGTVENIIKSPLLVLQAGDFLMKTNTQKKEDIKSSFSNFVISVKERPITTLTTTALTFYTTGKIIKLVGKAKIGVQSKSVSRAKLSSDAENILNKAYKKQGTKLSGEQFYGYKDVNIKQTRKVITTTPESTITTLEPASYYKVITPRPTVTVTTGKNIVIVKTPSGVQYTTIKVPKMFGKTSYVRTITQPSGSTSVKIFKMDTLVGKYKQTIKPSFVFAEPKYTTSTKQYISDYELRQELTTRRYLGELVKVKKSEVYPSGNIKTTVNENLLVKTTDLARIEKIGKPVIDFETGKIYPSGSFIELIKTKYKFVEYPAAKKPTLISRLDTGETIINRQAVSATQQGYKPRTTFNINLEPTVKPTSTSFIDRILKRQKGTGIKEGISTSELKSNIEGMYKGYKITKKDIISTSDKIIQTESSTIEAGAIRRKAASSKTLSNVNVPETETIFIQRPEQLKLPDLDLKFYNIISKPKTSPTLGLPSLKEYSSQKNIQPTIELTKNINIFKLSQKPAILSRQINNEMQINANIQRQFNRNIQRNIQNQMMVQQNKQLQIQQQIQVQTQTTINPTPMLNMRIKIPYEPPSIPFSIPFWFNKDVAINSKKKKKKQNIISPTEYTPDLYSTIGGIQAPKGFKTNPVKGFTGIEQRPLIAKKKKKLFF